MRRRAALKAIGVATLGTLPVTTMAKIHAEERSLSKQHTTSLPTKGSADIHSPSSSNPIATVDQIELERLALAMMQMPAIRKAAAQASQRWKLMAGRYVPAEAWQNFDAMMEEWAFHYVMLALNSDPNYPKIVNNNFGAPHEWFGMKVPGSRCPGNGEAVDNNYSFAPIDGHGHYELRGKRMTPSTGDCPVHIATNLSMSMNVDGLGLRDTKIDPDGSFVITIGPEPAAGRSNHLQTTVDSRYVYIRDARTDWRQVPTQFRIRRLDRPLGPPMTIEQKTAMAARFIIDDVGIGFMYRQLVSTQAINTVTAPEVSTAFGGQASQRVARCHLDLADDEAFMLTLSPGGADYVSVIAYNYWLTSLNYWDHTSSLNTSQSVGNADGSYTYVISGSDPGVYNWIDTTGLHETMILLRWQLLPKNPDDTYGGNPWTRGIKCKLSELDGLLLPETKRVSSSERQNQLARRRAEFDLRFVDH